MPLDLVWQTRRSMKAKLTFHSSDHDDNQRRTSYQTIYLYSQPVRPYTNICKVLGGIADTVAQTLTAVRQNNARKRDGSNNDSFFAIEFEDLDRKSPVNEDMVIPNSLLPPPPFDFERLTRFMAYGFLMAPVQHWWYSFLSATFPSAKGTRTSSAVKKVAFDQFLFAPISLGIFFTFMTVAEGGGRRAVMKKFKDVYVPALKANFMVWPAVQTLNFRVLPLQYQIVSPPVDPVSALAFLT